MYWVIGLIVVLGIITGVYKFLKINKAHGIMQVILAIVCSVMAIWFCSLKESRSFGGTDWEFMVQSAIFDGEIYPLVVLILLVVEIFLIAKTFIKLEK